MNGGRGNSGCSGGHEGKDNEIHIGAHVSSFLYDQQYPSASGCNEWAAEESRSWPYNHIRKSTLCAPTSALRKK